MKTRLHFRQGDELDLLFQGPAYFSALIGAIEQARQEVVLESYIFANDAVGQRVSAALLLAVQRGVTVRIITDGIGTGGMPLFADWAAGGIAHRIYNPHLFGKQGFSRTHRKLAVIDRLCGFVGGINIIDDVDAHGAKLPEARWDFAVRCQGPIVRDIWQAFDTQWQRLSPGDIGPFIRRRRYRLKPSDAPMAAFAARDNIRNRRAIEKAYLMAIGHARETVWLANPYFVPGRRVRRALIAAAGRGIQVNVLIGRKEFPLLDLAVPSLYGKLLRAGVCIAEYDRTPLHGKVAVVDDYWATVGSSNLDAFSLFLNHEANVVMLNHPLVPELRQRIAAAFEQARRIEPARFAGRGLSRRLVSWGAYLFYRLSMKIITNGKYE
ncbi:cardiolipin synthase ClsB [Pandoraea sp.]|uniref:cardiolipin synthase ClsB n=1 Tax=Pandoraea sp. TaxID=1883445 RepID=UPI001215008C|nr:cardiolipin synthase ClsB [Pandoraea sp.]TAL56073.1 MAG: cardiolipin synthase ClsB [Pandoraea sp.]TAM19013.1 MAG: cardiolipin synthase ClsB [Pandoraea sp.]